MSYRTWQLFCLVLIAFIVLPPCTRADAPDDEAGHVMLDTPSEKPVAPDASRFIMDAPMAPTTPLPDGWILAEPAAPTEPDLSILDAEGLRILVRNLLQKIRVLEELHAAEPSSKALLTEMQIDNQRLRVRLLDEQVRVRLLLKEVASMRQIQSGAAVATAPTPAAPRASRGVRPYSYEYEFSMISSSGRGNVTIRDRNGGKSRVRYSYDEYYDDRIEVEIYFRNISIRPASFSMVIAAGSRLTTDKRRVVLATTTYRTPVLQPRELHRFTQVMMVSNPRHVQVIEIGEVRSTTY